jgi:hypothetical protein
VTCGDVAIEKAVIVPKSLYSLMLTRLQEFTPSKDYKHPTLSHWGAKRALQGFLGQRCSKEFLTLYIEHNPGLLGQVSEPGLFLDSVPEVDLAQRLHEFGLLTEENRKKFVETASDYAITGQDTAPRYLLRDRDRIYGDAFRIQTAGMQITEVLTPPQAPWQSPYVERLIGSIRRECLDHVIILGVESLRRILQSCITYYHDSRCHLSLDKDSPETRKVQPPDKGIVVEIPKVGGLHHRYERRAA